MVETATIEKPVSPETSPAPAEEKTPAEGGEGTAEEEKEPTDEEIDAIQPGKASPMDPDFILIFIFALIVDLAVDPIMKTIGVALTAGALEIVNLIIDVICFAIIGGWIYWKSKQFVMPEAMAQRMKKMEGRIMAKIQAKIQKKVASKALRKVLIRAGGALVIEAIPVVGVFTSWVAAVISMVL